MAKRRRKPNTPAKPATPATPATPDVGPAKPTAPTDAPTAAVDSLDPEATGAADEPGLFTRVMNVPWVIAEKLRFPTLPPKLERWIGANGWVWIALLAAIPVAYIGFALTVGVTSFGFPKEVQPRVDVDYWWHLGTGQWMLDHGQIPHTDPYLWTYGGKWVAHEWLAEFLLAVQDRIAGYAASIVFTLVLGVLGYWALAIAVRLYGFSARGMVLVTALWGGVMLRGGILVVRPQFWTFAFFGFLFLAIAAYDTGRTKRLWWLVPLFFIWVNINLTVTIALICLATFAIDQTIRKRSIDRHLLVVSLLCAAPLVVNPFGPALVETALRYRDQPAFWGQHVFEWTSPFKTRPGGFYVWKAYEFGGGFPWVHPNPEAPAVALATARRTIHDLVPFLLAIPVALLAGWQLVRGRIWPAIPMLVLLYQACNASRFVPLYVLLTILFTGWLAWQHHLDRDTPIALPADIRSRVPWVLLVAGLTAACVFWVASTSDASQFRRDPVTTGFPEQGATVYEEELADRRIFNVYDFGGYLIYRYQGEPKIYIDGRNEMYSPEFLVHYFDLISGEADWQTEFREQGIDVILVRPFDGIASEVARDPEWQRINIQDENAVMFVRRPPAAPGDNPDGNFQPQESFGG